MNQEINERAEKRFRVTSPKISFVSAVFVGDIDKSYVNIKKLPRNMIYTYSIEGYYNKWNATRTLNEIKNYLNQVLFFLHRSL